MGEGEGVGGGGRRAFGSPGVTREKDMELSLKTTPRVIGTKQKKRKIGERRGEKR